MLRTKLQLYKKELILLALAITCCCLFGYAGYVIRHPSPNNGIIILEGFADGVVICGEAVVINHGHERDPQVAQLLDLADRNCPVNK